MSNTIYWAVKLDSASKATLLAKMPPTHNNVFAEHMTIAFRPSDLVEEELVGRIGEKVALTVVGQTIDDKGQAAVVISYDVRRIDYGTAHITISCANGTKPVYSHELVEFGRVIFQPAFDITGVIARFTNNGWEME
jgi:hypothetical protein